MSLDFLHLSNNNLRSSGMHELICLLLKGRRVGSLPLKSHPQPMFEIIVRFRRLKAVPKLWESHYNRKGRKGMDFRYCIFIAHSLPPSFECVRNKWVAGLGDLNFPAFFHPH